MTNLVDVSDDEDDFQKVQIILMIQETTNNEIFVTKMLCSAVIDTACSQTITGKEWFDNYTKILDDISLNKIFYFSHILHLNLVNTGPMT